MIRLLAGILLLAACIYLVVDTRHGRHAKTYCDIPMTIVTARSDVCRGHDSCEHFAAAKRRSFMKEHYPDLFPLFESLAAREELQTELFKFCVIHYQGGIYAEIPVDAAMIRSLTTPDPDQEEELQFSARGNEFEVFASIPHSLALTKILSEIRRACGSNGEKIAESGLTSFGAIARRAIKTQLRTNTIRILHT